MYWLIWEIPGHSVWCQPWIGGPGLIKKVIWGIHEKQCYKQCSFMISVSFFASEFHLNFWPKFPWSSWLAFSCEFFQNQAQLHCFHTWMLRLTCMLASLPGEIPRNFASACLWWIPSETTNLYSLCTIMHNSRCRLYTSFSWRAFLNLSCTQLQV